MRAQVGAEEYDRQLEESHDNEDPDEVVELCDYVDIRKDSESESETESKRSPDKKCAKKGQL